MTVSLVLASASPARRATLRAAGVEPVVIVSDVDEDAVLEAASREHLASHGTPLSPADAVLALARAKAESVAAGAGVPAGAYVLGCDSMLEFDGQVLGKPGTAEVAALRWRQMRGHSGTLHTGHWLIGPDLVGNGETGSTVVNFAHITDEELDAYIASGEPLVVAGAFTIDGRGGPFVESIEGDYHNVVGLSLPLLRRLLALWKVPFSALWAGASSAS